MTKLIEKKYVRVPSMGSLHVSADGDVVIKSSGEFIPAIKFIVNGYEVIHFYGEKLRVHRLIALTFIPNPDNKPFINHKDGNKVNNNVSNLEWCTQDENNYHATQVLKKNPQFSQREVLIYKDGILVNKAGSVREAARIVKGASTNISKCCSGIRKQHNGFTFAYADEMAKQVQKVLKNAPHPKLTL